MDKPLNGKDVEKIVGFPINMVPFSKMEEYKLDDLFTNDCCLINYLSGPRFGHWCCLVRNKKKNTITYFNPTGRFIDEAIEFLPEFKYISNQCFPHLLKKLYESKYKIHYMDKRLQRPNTNTCGRYCGLFMKLKGFSEDDIINLLKHKTNNEIIEITNQYLDYPNHNEIVDEIIEDPE